MLQTDKNTLVKGTPHAPIYGYATRTLYRYTSYISVHAQRWTLCAGRKHILLPFALALYGDTKGANIVTGVKLDILPEWKTTAPDETGDFGHRSIANA